MQPPSLSNELTLSLQELSFGVQSSEVLSTGPVAGSAGAPPMAKIIMSDATEFIVRVTERGWQVCDPVSQAPNPTRYETLDDLLTASNPTYANIRQNLLMEKLLAVAAQQSSRDEEPSHVTDE
ncbi:hypothetical protein RhiJN_25601 [Ceratobasidium sp. AG-Ba]|nr:hypothetical protein RhiJN_25601 [Ceratobasidium sp. AG-Ba]